VVFENPSTALAEIVWRWSIAAAGWFLSMLMGFEYLDTLHASALQRVLLRTGHPILVARVLRSIVRGSMFRLTEAGIFLLIGLTVGWIVVATIGRLVTIDAVAEQLGLARSRDESRVRSLLSINFLRAAIFLAVIAGSVGGLLISSSVWASSHVSLADASRIGSLIVVLAWFACVVLNWLLSTAGIAVALDRCSAMEGVATAVRLLQERPGAMVAAGALFGVAHIAIFIVAWFTVITAGATAGYFGGETAFLLVICIALAYFAVADSLYIARMAAYVAILRGDELDLVSAQPTPFTPPSRSWVDQDELILSDSALSAG
jgi:hypothetical protein